MIYVKILNENNEVLRMESMDNPIYVAVLKENGKLLRCTEEKSQGLLSQSGREILRWAGEDPLLREAGVAEKITLAEYMEYLQSVQQPEDPEDTDPVIPEEEMPEQVLTRAQLTQKVLELDEAIALLLSGVTE